MSSSATARTRSSRKAPGPVPDFEDLTRTFRNNLWPALAKDLAESLGIPLETLDGEEIGFYPAEQCFTFPEFDELGQMTGIMRRFFDGKKLCWPGSKRGLSYQRRATTAETESHHQTAYDGAEFVRVGEAGVPCPICGRENDGCLVSSDDVSDPAAVICVRTPAGAVKVLDSGAGYLHRRHAQAPQTATGGESPESATATDGRATPSVSSASGPVFLPLSDRPVVVTEGGSDRLYAKSLGYVAVGKPNDVGSKGLADLLRGRDVILVGDRDDHGAGQRGLEATFQMLRPSCRSVVKDLPPEGFKDLRQWHPTAEAFAAHVKAAGVVAPKLEELPRSYWEFSQRWVRDSWTDKLGNRLIHFVAGDWFTWDSTTGTYRKLGPTALDQLLYSALDGAEMLCDSGRAPYPKKLSADKFCCQNLRHAAAACCVLDIAPGTIEPLVIKTGKSLDVTRCVVFSNGILDIADDTLMPLSPEIFLTSTLPTAYRPGVRGVDCLCPLWLATINQIFNADDERIALLQEWFGYNLIASNHMQSMMFFFGVPGSGKSTIANVLRSVLGAHRCCAASTDTFKGQFGVAKLVGKFAAIMSESRGTQRHDIDKLLQTWKAITGGDTIDVRQLYQPHQDARLFCRLTYVANDAIPFDDASQAMANRMHLLYFPNNYRKGKPDWSLERKLLQELPGITLWAIEGLKRLLAAGRFTLPKSSEEQLTDLAEITDPIGLMLKECTELDPTAETRVGDLFDLWLAWSKRNHHFTLAMSNKAFGKQVHIRFGEAIERKKRMVNGENFYVYQGLKLLPGVFEHYCK